MNTLILATTFLISQSLSIKTVEYEVETFSTEKHQVEIFDARKILEDKNNLIYSIDLEACMIQMSSYQYIKENLYYSWADLDDVGNSIVFKINKEKQRCFMFVKKRMLKRKVKKIKRLKFQQNASAIIAILLGASQNSKRMSNSRQHYNNSSRKRFRRPKNNKIKRRGRPIKRVYY